ncbi:hypothetical protein F4861DRAFT_542716 [Xylaria intraflava]|nr:hypothetical protein F4861DRAFT_542716 [Xylaria intraflava]
MAAPESSQRVADIQRRAAEKPEVAFKAFDTYPWQVDQSFNRQLSSALYAAEPNGIVLAEIALQMRIDRFAERIKIQIDKDAYKSWLVETGSLQPRLFSDQNLAREAEGMVHPEQRRFAVLHAEYGYPPSQAATGPVDDSIPSWQREAPKAELYVPKTASVSNSDGGAVPYPKKFEEIIKFLETGQVIPGIRQIPDTVIDDPSISTRGTMQAPLKPWERNRTAAQNSSTSSSDDTIPNAGITS